MLLGQQQITTGDKRRYQVDYTQFLQFGEVLTTSSVSVNSGATSTASGAYFDVTETQLYFFVVGGKLGESFTVSIQVGTNFGEVVNDTIAYMVISP